MSSKLRLQPLFHLRSAAIVLSLAAIAALPACAQQEQAAPSQPIAVSSTTPSLNLFSSSAAGAQDDAAANQSLILGFSPHIGPNADAAPQYGGGYGGPPRRRPYGRPAYKDRWTNSDGSSKFAFEAGVGPTIPAGSTGHYSRTGVDVSLGAGRNFSRVFGVLVQYDYAHMGVVNSALNAFIANNGGCSNCTSTAATHLWSLTLNPVITFANSHSQWGTYFVGGAGLYRKMTVFTIVDNFSGSTFACGVSTNSCHFSNNAFGANGGLGFFYKITPDGSAKIFAEARYTWVDNKPSVNNTTANGGFPQTNQRTGYFPVTIGVRF